MPITSVSGDIFVNRCHAQAIGHGCNCQGSMGAGVAKGFRERYPEMYAEYRGKCKVVPREFNLGDSWMWMAPDGLVIFNLGTQEQYWHARASYEAIETALQRMKAQAVENGINSIAIPRIGTGYGGLSWKKVWEIAERVFGEWDGTLYVYEEYSPEQAPSI